MSSLRDQMLKAGLVSEKDARQSAHHKRQQAKAAKAHPPPPPAEEDAAARALREQQAHDRDLNARAKAEAEARERELRERQHHEAALDKALREGVLHGWQGNRDYHFSDGGVVQRLRVTDEAARRLEAGKAAIVRLPGTAGGYAVVVAGAAEQLRQADPARIATFHRQG